MILKIPFISSSRLLLRLGNKKDVPEIINYFYKNQEHLAPWQPLWHSNFLTPGFWQQQVEENLKEFQGDRSLKLFVFKTTYPTEIIGQVNFNNFVRGAAQFCYLGYSLAEIEQGKGYMAEALQAAIDYVFQELNIHRVIANYIPQNQRSANVLSKLEFVREGYAREYLFINGKWQDHVLTSLTNKDWQGR